MKKIKEFSEGERLKQPLLVNQCNKGVTNNGSPYLSIHFQDNTGNIEGKFWDVSEYISELIKPGMVVEVSADVLKYKQALQLRVTNLIPCEEGSYSLDDFITSTNIDRTLLKQTIDDGINSIKNPVLHAMVKEAVASNESDFYEYPAASKNHHDFVGGLATHVYGMLKVADALCTIYPLINRDLLISGVIVHDIGKIVEYSGPVLAEFTTEGKLIGHISMMNAFLYEVSVRLGYENTEEAMLLRHLVLSHHGEYEYGSPVLPLTVEAEMLNYVDNIDARMNMMDKALSGLEPGTFTPRIFSLENRSFYKPVFDAKKD